MQCMGTLSSNINFPTCFLHNLVRRHGGFFAALNSEEFTLSLLNILQNLSNHRVTPFNAKEDFAEKFFVAAKPTTLLGTNSSSSNKVQRKDKTVQTNMVAYVVWAINYKSEISFDLRGCLEVIVASKPYFLCWSQFDGSS